MRKDVSSGAQLKRRVIRFGLNKIMVTREEIEHVLSNYRDGGAGTTSNQTRSCAAFLLPHGLEYRTTRHLALCQPVTFLHNLWAVP
jgi:hypothetical protein